MARAWGVHPDSPAPSPSPYQLSLYAPAELLGPSDSKPSRAPKLLPWA